MAKVETTFTSNDKDVLASYAKLQRENEKLRSQSEKTNQSQQRSGRVQQRLINAQVRGAFGLIGQYVGLQAVIGGVTAAYEKQEARLKALAERSKEYVATVSKLSAASGASPDQLASLFGSLDTTKERAQKAFSGIQSQGSVDFARASELTAAAVGSRRIGVDEQEFGELIAALNKLDPKATGSVLRDQALLALRQGLSGSEISRLAEVDKTDRQGILARNKLRSQLAGAGGLFESTAQQFAGSAIGREQIYLQNTEISSERANRRKELLARTNQAYAEEFDRQSSQQGLIGEFLGDTFYNAVRVGSKLVGQDDADVRAYETIAPLINGGLSAGLFGADQQDAIQRNQVLKFSEDQVGLFRAQEALINSMNENTQQQRRQQQRATYNGLNNAERGK